MNQRSFNTTCDVGFSYALTLVVDISNTCRNIGSFFPMSSLVLKLFTIDWINKKMERSVKQGFYFQVIQKASYVRMVTGLWTASVLVLSNLFMFASSGVAYSSRCPKISPLTEMTVDEVLGMYHDAKHTSVTPYLDASYCNYKNGTTTFVTKFYSTMAATKKPYNIDILWDLAFNKEEPVGYYADVYFGYYEPQQLWFLGLDPDPVDGYCCVFSCNEQKDGTLTFIFQYEPRGCKMTEKHEKNMDEILVKNNLKGRDYFKLEDGTTDQCVEDIHCPPEFKYQ